MKPRFYISDFEFIMHYAIAIASGVVAAALLWLVAWWLSLIIAPIVVLFVYWVIAELTTPSSY